MSRAGQCAVKAAAWGAVWLALEVLWMERHRRRAAERDAQCVWDGWVTVGFVGDEATGEYHMYRLHPSNPAWRPVDGPRALN